MGDASRTLLRAASTASSRITHPAARYSAGGALSCALCKAPVAASWDAHLASAAHKASVAALRASASSAPAPPPAPSPLPPPPAPAQLAAAAAAAASPALPAGFFSDPEADARARGVDFRAAQAAAQAAEVEEFMKWTAEVAAEGEVEAAAEAARYEARSEAGAEEAALYRARAAVLRELVEGGRLVGGGGGSGGGGEVTAEESELLGAASLLAGGAAGGEGEGGGGGASGGAPAVTAAELSGLLAERLARKRPWPAPPAAGEGAGRSGSSEGEDLLDWRRKGVGGARR